VPYVQLRKENAVYVLTMINGSEPNTLTSDVLRAFHECLDEVERAKENCALVITSGHPKVWNTGINLDWLLQQPTEMYSVFKGELDKFYLRLALLDAPTIGCLTGHTYAGGAILAAALDFRFMRRDKGWICFPEVDIRIPFTPIMHAVISLLPSPQTLRDMALTGVRFGGEEAAKRGIVDGAFSEDELFPKVMEHAAMMAQKDRATYASIKRGLRRELVQFSQDCSGGH
jgi:enoyl-CoA hydratase/carnithine racemase